MKTVGTRREGVGYDHRLAARFQMLARTIPVMAAPPARIPTPVVSAYVPALRLIEGKKKGREKAKEDDLPIYPSRCTARSMSIRND
jgi:hypothetical protein